jgi:hypothetical protein
MIEETTSAITAAPTIVEANAAAAAASISVFGFTINAPTLMIFVILAVVFFMCYRIQRNGTLDFSDMFTKDGRSVSLTKVLQFVGGVTATWIMIKLTITGGLTESLFGLYLAYVGAIEGYSKFVAAKYGYNEKSVKDADSAISKDNS